MYICICMCNMHMQKNIKYIYIYIYISYISRTASEWCVRCGGSAAQHKVQCPTGRFVHISKKGGGVCPHPTSMVCHKLWDCTWVLTTNVPSRERGILGEPCLKLRWLGMAIVRHAYRSINQPKAVGAKFSLANQRD